MSASANGSGAAPGSMGGALNGGAGDFTAMAGGQTGAGQMGSQLDGVGGQAGGDGNALLAQQQALMAMTGGAPAGGFDAGASREALMNLLTRQGFGGGAMGAGMGQMGAGMGQMAGMPGQQGFGGMAGFQGQQGFGAALGGVGGQDAAAGQDAQNAAMMGAFGTPSPAFSGMGMAGMGMAGMGMMGMNPMMGGMSTLGSGNFLGAATSGMVGDGTNKGMGDGSGRGTDGAQNNGMTQQNMLLQQMLQQQAAASGGLWQQYGNMAPGMMGADGAAAGAAGLPPGYLSMLGQGAGAGASGAGRDAGEAGVFQSGAMPDFAKSGKKARPKKPKNKPKRPLSAYNIFFKDERAKILAGIPDKKGEDGEEEDEEKKVKTEGATEGEGEKEGGSSAGAEGGGEEKEDANKKTSGKKRKRVPHGKIGFESLAKIVGQRWKELPPEELDIYKKRAEDDMKRYRKEMEAYVQKQRQGLEQSREHLEKLVDEETKKRYFGDGAGAGV